MLVFVPLAPRLFIPRDPVHALTRTGQDLKRPDAARA